MAYRNTNAFVPGINDLVYGNKKNNIVPANEKIERGKLAIRSLSEYKKAKDNNEKQIAAAALETFEENYKYLGYGYMPDKESIVPSIPVTFYSFHLMVILGMWFVILFVLVLYYMLRGEIEKKKIILWSAILSIPLGYIASELGWIVSEVGRQPWTIQDILPTMISTSHLSTRNVQITFCLFAVLFTVLLITEIRIMIKQIKMGPGD